MKFDTENIKASLSASSESMKDFDWRSLKKYTSTRAFNDLNNFLEALPQHISQTMLIIAGVAWLVAGGVGLYVTIQLKSLTELRIELENSEAVQPAVPSIKNVAVKARDISAFSQELQNIYSGLSIKTQGSAIVLQAKDTAYFGQFREAMSHVFNGGKGWRTSVDYMCVGRECPKFPLNATLKINKISVQNPNE